MNAEPLETGILIEDESELFDFNVMLTKNEDLSDRMTSSRFLSLDKEIEPMNGIQKWSRTSLLANEGPQT